MSDMQTEDGVEVPRPKDRKVHSHGFYKSSLGYQVRAVVVEMVYPSFIMLSGQITPDDGTWDSVLAEFLGGIVSLRLSEGYTLDNLTGRSAVLREAKVWR